MNFPLRALARLSTRNSDNNHRYRSGSVRRPVYIAKRHIKPAPELSISSNIYIYIYIYPDIYR